MLRRYMAIHNIEIANIFNKLANLLEIANENPFRIRAYRNAARVIGGLSHNAADLVEDGGDLTGLPGIGKDLAEKIRIIVKTGELPLLKKMEKRVPPVLNELLKIEGLGPKRVQLLHKKLGIQNLNDLKKCIESGKLRKLRGFGEKAEQKILSGMQHIREYSQRVKLVDAITIERSIIQYLKKSKYVKKVECAGSFRRRKETVGDLDIVVASSDTKKSIEYFVRFDEIATVVSQGNTRSTVRLHSGIQVDLRSVPLESYGAALLYFTGSKAHSIAIRKLAQKKNLKLNEYGIYKGNKKVAGKTEEEMYRQIGLAYIEPEIREDRGEIELARKHQLPRLITLKDIRGDLHCHTNATDGDASIEMMAQKAQELGYQYIAITDHSKHLAMAHGLNEKRLFAQIKLIDKLNSKLKNIVILKSIEVDILEDGSLDLPKNILKELDFTVCSIHSKFNLNSKKQTGRIIRAMDNPFFNILAHPTGRLINQREPYEIDLEKIMESAKERNCILELNAQPERMDMDDIHCKIAKELRLKMAISSDAHSKSQMDYIKFGVYQARRGWLEATDVINTRTVSELKKLFRRS
ncbi:DNA polymerase III [Gammaproteobacteria bacterium SCGC AG-212-F23]|nr:DNA polymerase III [Gammaproteobacteria bacterium SCGC AG-212-F23]